MAGSGTRFVTAGYTEPKPLIKIGGKPMIEWVVNLFPKTSEFIFICQNQHLKETNLRQVLMNLSQNSKILGIESHSKGPVHSITKAFHLLTDDDPVLISYCDYYMHWDFYDFKNFLEEHQPDGCVPCYSGFHPHLIPRNNIYASCRVEKDNRLIEIREKYSFTEDKFKGFHSPGLYYFDKSIDLKKMSHTLLLSNEAIQGEFYVSQLFQLMIERKKNITFYDKIPHFCQWGTPADLNEYEFWTQSIGKIL